MVPRVDEPRVAIIALWAFWNQNSTLPPSFQLWAHSCSLVSQFAMCFLLALHGDSFGHW